VIAQPYVFFHAIHLNAFYRVEYGLQKQKPHNSLCGLGSWREQQQTIDANQKNCLPSDKTTQETMGFNN
jgi:hypothetical protein